MVRPGQTRGIFIAFEGPEGAGKSTQVARLAAALRDGDRDVVVTREPGGTAVGEGIRTVLLDRARGSEVAPWTDALLFNAARAALVREVIHPALERGAIVLCDRFADSTLAYQGYGSGLPITALREVERFATGGLRPDLVIVLDVPVELGLGRKGDEQTRFETAFDLAFHRRVRDGFLALARDEPERYVVLDATSPADAVAAAVLAAVERLGLPIEAEGGAAGEPTVPVVRTRG